MDFQFTAHNGQVSVRCSMEQIALANWFNSEVRSNPEIALTALRHLENLAPQQQVSLLGAEYSLFMDADEVMVRANNLNIESATELEDDFHYYDEESIAFCGTDDFAHFLKSYLEFIQQ